MQYKSKENFTLKHFQERINIYTEEEFDYEIHNINLKVLINSYMTIQQHRLSHKLN